MRTSAQRNSLKTRLERILAEFVVEQQQNEDAIEPALHYREWHDRELAAFVCAMLAYGRVPQIKKSAHQLLDPMAASPHRWLTTATPARVAELTAHWRHRFNTGDDMRLLLLGLRSAYQKQGSLENVFTSGQMCRTSQELIERVQNLTEKIYKWSSQFGRPAKSFSFLLPNATAGGAFKRMNLFLRWMVGTGPMDFGLWKTVDKAALIIPLDVHVLRQARSLGLTRRKGGDLRTALEITGALRRLDPNDPTRFDFALCHSGIRGQNLRARSSEK